MLRYVLYECDQKLVKLKNEISYIANYIKLFSLKSSEQYPIELNCDNVNKDIYIAPMLLIPFVENAFKHSKIEDLKNGFITISLKTENKNIEFVIENSIPNIAFKKDKVGGIGLLNSKQRLELLYPNKHLLSISISGNVYSVYLKLDLE